jgi:tetratricopeptide (TPR) repeat protein
MYHHRISSLLVAVLIPTSLAVAAPQTKPAEPENPAAVLRIVQDAYAALQQKDYEAARQASLKALALDSHQQYALSYLGHACSMLGDFAEAEEAYRTLIALNPRHTYAYGNLGLVYGKQGRTDEAIANFRKQLEISPRNRYASSNLARAFAFERKWEQALPPATMATEVAPEEPKYWQFLGKVQIKMGRVDDARRSFDRALALPHEPSIENDIAYELADASVDLDRSWGLISAALRKSEGLLCEPAALSDGDKCTSQLRQLSSMLDTAGWVLYRQGKIQEAEPYLSSAFAITPRGEVELHRVVVLAELRRLEEAAKLYAEVRTHPNFDLADSHETIRELTNAAGGDAELDTLLDRVAPPTPDGLAQAKVIAMVDGSGRVTGTGTVDPVLPGPAEAAKSLTLPALSWPGHSVPSIRTIEFLSVDGRWTPVQSYVGTTPPPPPCGIVPQQRFLVTRNAGSAGQSGGCPADF